MALADLSNLESMSWTDLNRLREHYAGNPDVQNILAPYEHRAYYREYVHNPLDATAMFIAEPVYQGFKGLQSLIPSLNSVMPRNDMTTSPSLSQIGQSWKGIGEGLLLRNNR
jgi:hypothetical protein